MGDLGQAVDELGYLVAKILLDRIQVDKRVLYDVMEQACSDADVVQTHVGEDLSHLERMDKVRLARGPFLTSMMKRRKEISTPDQINICAGTVLIDFFYDIFDSDH